MADGQDHIMWPAATVSGLSECGPSVAFTLVGHYALYCLTGDGDDDKDVGGPSDPGQGREDTNHNIGSVAGDSVEVEDADSGGG